MKITGFCPLILSRDADAIVETFKALGFEKRHTKTDIEGGDNTAYAMKDANGNRLSIASVEAIPQDMTAVCINVDNFQEAYDFFIARGFINPRGEGAFTETSSSRSTMLISPSGFAVTIGEHLK